jgi:allophanate hydrolase subunit 1
MIDDMNFIVQSLDPLRTSFTELSKELVQTLSKIDKAEQASEVIVAKAWYDAVCDELQTVVSEAKSMSNRPIDAHKVRIG